MSSICVDPFQNPPVGTVIGDEEEEPPKKVARTEEYSMRSIDDSEEKSVVASADEMEVDDAEVDEIEDNAWDEFAAATLDFPTIIPFQFKYKLRKFYVRGCYARYYKYIVDQFKKKRNGCCVCHRDTRHWQVDVHGLLLYTLVALYEQYSDALVLLDGPPTAEPKELKFVTFTSPNEDWFKKVDKESYHVKIYMPLWEEDELTEAVEMLELRDQFERLDLGEEFPRPAGDLRYQKEEVYRFDVFGGVAHVCLSTRYEFVTDQLERLKDAIDAADTASTRAVFKRPTLQLASEYVKILLSLRILALSEEAKANLKNAIDKQPESAVLYGFIHEQCVHSQLKNQYDLVARQLVRSNAVRTARSVITSDPNKTGEPLLLKTPGTESVELESNFALADLAAGTYFTPKSKTMESIESIYLVKPDSTINAPRSNVDVVLFQATVSRSHPMKGSGLYNVLKQLQIAKNNFPKRVAVVFAVPKSRELSFMHQTIVTSQPLETLVRSLP
ncbi:hypothetical protein Poli38472_014656 [Pythium oligandrum]|uniref:Uncharacterized protein n=1 Tax=Pythium oligandrum TaxID=41045 RepID=A0A8K1CI15_PYTOL|nr:hypothetical protein Poli38472_014656 [Pythium oligandrum]|eukprot:TMW63951.1 hypothetical protein Poli38472_014656 [Pythium oligandrum]